MNDVEESEMKRLKALADMAEEWAQIGERSTQAVLHGNFITWLRRYQALKERLVLEARKKSPDG